MSEFERFEKIENADLRNFSTMRTGGRAKVVVFPKNHQEIIEILKICKKNGQKTLILGNGSNILFDDRGFDGVIISMKHFDKVTKCDGGVWVGAGINLFALNHKLQKLGLSGMEWSYGIPATIGGMIVGNGGCFGHDMAEAVREVVVLDGERIKRLKRADIDFDYRNSSLRNFVVLKAKIALKSEKNGQILQNMNDFCNQKRLSQPCEFPSLGSVFKQIRGKEIIYPAKLIDNMGLKGVKIGGAEVSTKHAGFIVNKGGATSADVLELVEFIEEKLHSAGVNAEREIVVLTEKS